MSTLYLDRKDLKLQVCANHLRLSPSGHGRGSIPLNLISRLVLCGNVSLDTATLGKITAHGIPIICLSGRSHQLVAHVNSNLGNDGQRRLAQYRSLSNNLFKSDLARQCIMAKLQAAQRELQQWQKNRPDQRHRLFKSAHTVAHIVAKLDTATLPELRGYEGAAAAAWYRALAAVLPDSLNFSGRNRRPPRDPVNACLSLAYTLLHAEALAVCHMHGLDPMLGYLHEPVHGRESLACDLIEPLRPRIDVLLLPMFSQRTLRTDHFAHGANGCRMNKTGRMHFYRWWESHARSLRRYLRMSAWHLLRELQQS